MFGNSRFRLKLGGALVAIALLGVSAARRGQTINPPLWHCVAEPGRWEGKELWLPSGKIVAVRDLGFTVDDGDVRLRIDGPAPGAIGDRVTLRGTFRADGPHLDLREARILPADLQARRRLMEAVSVLVVLIVLANFARHFLFRPQVLQVKSDG